MRKEVVMMMFPLEFVYDSSQTEVGFALDFFFLCRCGIDFSLFVWRIYFLKEITFLMTW